VICYGLCWVLMMPKGMKSSMSNWEVTCLTMSQVCAVCQGVALFVYCYGLC
jgi:hypothetical protein